MQGSWSGRFSIYRKCADRYDAFYVHIDFRLHALIFSADSAEEIAEESKRLSQKAIMARNRAYPMMGDARGHTHAHGSGPK